MFTEEQIKELLANWSVDEEQSKQFIEELKAKENVDQTSEVVEGGEPTTNEDNDKKVETGEVVETEEGGEPTKEEKPTAKEVNNVQENEVYAKRIDALEARIADLISTLEGLAAANKRNEEIIGSLGEKVKGKPAPFGDIKSTDARELKSNPKEEAEKTMDFLGKLAGKR